MSACTPILTATVDCVLRELNQHGARYAVLRNYERFPSLERDGDPTARTDVDLVVDSRDIPAWREIAKTVAKREGWDVLTECDHWMQSAARSHNIEVFRFYCFSPLEFLQVDLFHSGHTLYGLPLLDEQGLLVGRTVLPGLTFPCIDPAKENMVRLQKIHGLAQSSPSQRKLVRYRDKLLRFWATNRRQFEKVIRTHFSIFGVQAIQALQQGDMARFLQRMKWAKAWFFAKFALSHPVQTPWYLVSRARDNRKRFFTRQCGCVVNVYAPEEQQRRLLRDVMNELAVRNVFDDWEEKNAASSITGGQRAVMEQGGLVIQWSDREAARVDAQKSFDSQTLTRELVRVLVEQDKILFLSRTLRDWGSGRKTAKPQSK